VAASRCAVCKTCSSVSAEQGPEMITPPALELDLIKLFLSIIFISKLFI
jgi:hypothetical protein